MYLTLEVYLLIGNTKEIGTYVEFAHEGPQAVAFGHPMVPSIGDTLSFGDDYYETLEHCVVTDRIIALDGSIRLVGEITGWSADNQWDVLENALCEKLAKNGWAEAERMSPAERTSPSHRRLAR